MLFNSLDFAIFLPIVFVLYWLIPSKYINSQNLFLVLASYLFYSWWDWRFLSLIFISTIVDYSVGLALNNQNKQNKRKVLLLISLTINLGLLGFFKYYNFFVDNFITAFSFFGKEINSSSLNIILPVGISFYTFQTMSYTIDIYRNKLKPTNNFIAFAAFVSFFPQLVAGPIERATNFLPQFLSKRAFKYNQATDGLKQMLWGLFKKIVIADNCAEIVDSVFYYSNYYPASSLGIAAVLFTVQIYADFSGYSDIAIGTARLFGFSLKQNFAFPLFAKNIPELWRRWHISLTSWLHDYIYTPVAIHSRNWGNWGLVFSTVLTFLICGFWHGPSWKYIVFGALNSLPYIYRIFLFKKHKVLTKYIPKPIKYYLGIIQTFIFWTFTLIVFRANNLAHAKAIIGKIFTFEIFTTPYFNKLGTLGFTLLLISIFFIVEWMGRKNLYAIEFLGHKQAQPLRWFIYAFIIFSIGMYMQTNVSPFIYFQF